MSDTTQTPDPQIRYFGDLQKIKAKPGDIFILHYPDGSLSESEMVSLKATWDKHMPNNPMLILSDDIEFSQVSAETDK